MDIIMLFSALLNVTPPYSVYYREMLFQNNTDGNTIYISLLIVVYPFFREFSDRFPHLPGRPVPATRD